MDGPEPGGRPPASAERGLIFDLKRDAWEDGPGIRTTVFFKGCPLSCVWCQNPEGISPHPALSFDAASCAPDRCGGLCVPLCRWGVLRPGQAPAWGDCDRCDRCQNACPELAIRPLGRWYDVDELVARIVVDAPFFRQSGGGVTLSGGEPLMQPRFAAQLLARLHEEGIGAVLETCGFYAHEFFVAEVLPFLKRVYFDLKIFDHGDSFRLTGQGSRAIQDNLRRLVPLAGERLVVRIPLIPGLTTGVDNLVGLADFLRRVGVSQVELLSYNPTWQDKVGRFGIVPRFSLRTFASQEQEADWRQVFWERFEAPTSAGPGRSSPWQGLGQRPRNSANIF